MKRTLMMLAATAAAALSLAPAAGAAPAQNTAEIIGVVKAGPGATATVRARYTCEDGFHLWVSAKQVADRSRNPILEGPESSAHSAAWIQSHPAPDTFTCDGRQHVDTFAIDTAEAGFGELRRGEAWVQFCMYGATTAISEGSWERVR